MVTVTVINIEREPFSLDLYKEILPLAQKCWEENTKVKAESCAFYGERDFAVEPDVDTYKRLADEGSMLIVTLRDERLEGYIIGFLYRSWHHKKLLCGNVDSIYVEPRYRSYTLVMTERLEKEMRKAGAVIIGWPAHPASPVYDLLTALGYVGDDVVMEKKLCVSQ